MDNAQITNLVEKIIDWKNKYSNIFAVKIAGELFIIRPLTRSEFNKIMEFDANDVLKENMVCETATLYPENYDFETCIAGIPTELAKKILEESLLMLDDKARSVLNKFRDEMKEYQHQISCIIVEAFPTLNIDEVETWDMYKTLKYLSRAEWVLTQLRGLPIVSANTKQKQREEVPKNINSINNNVNDNTKNKKGINYEELQKLKQQFPEIDWENDCLLNGTFNIDEESRLFFDPEYAR